MLQQKQNLVFALVATTFLSGVEKNAQPES